MTEATYEKSHFRVTATQRVLPWVSELIIGTAIHFLIADLSSVAESARGMPGKCYSAKCASGSILSLRCNCEALAPVPSGFVLLP